MNAGKAMFKALAFQYKPLEKQFRLLCKGRPDLIEKYDKADYYVKIQMLDRTAQHLGL